MDIVVTNQAGVRKVFYEFQTDVAAALIHAGIAQRYSKPAPVPEEGPHWVVTNPPRSGLTDFVLAWTDGRGAITYFPGITPAAALKNPPVCQGLRCPLEVLDTFMRLQGVQLDPETERERLRLQQNAEAVRQQKEREQMHRWM